MPSSHSAVGVFEETVRSVSAIVCAGPSCRGAGRTKLCTVVRKVDDKRRRSMLVAAVVSGQRSKVRGRLAGPRRKKSLRLALKSVS